MKMCKVCQELYENEYKPAVCAAGAGLMIEAPVAGGGTAKFESVGCGGELKTVNCLVCLDTGFVVILDPRHSEPEKVTCPRKCGVK